MDANTWITIVSTLGFPIVYVRPHGMVCKIYHGSEPG